MNKRFYLNGDDWQLRGCYKHQWVQDRTMELGDVSRFPLPMIRASVPGAVQVDLMQAGFIQDPNLAFNSRAAEWVENREWIYSKTFFVPQGLRGQRYYLRFKGLDYWGEVRLNKVKVCTFEGTMIPVQVDVTDILDLAGENRLDVVFYQNPEIDGQYGYTSRVDKIKPRFNYNWDWCPRMVPVGIWDDVYIDVIGDLQVTDFYPRANLELDTSTGILDTQLQLEVLKKGHYEIRTTITSMQTGEVILEDTKSYSLMVGQCAKTLTLRIPDVDFWWPRGYGKQALYEVILEVYGPAGLVQRTSKNVGFRHMEIVPNPNSPEGTEPYTVIWNGKRLFLQGVNWVPISPYYGTVTRDDYIKYIGRFAQMNCNILRVWGGAMLEKAAFYEECDQLGILVWQEFFQSSSGIENRPSDDPAFMRALAEAARCSITRRRHHVSLMVWCGGNELLMEGASKPADADHPNLKMLKELVCHLDPDRVFLPCSPSGPSFSAAEENFGKGIHHDVHGNWVYLGSKHHYRYYNQDDALIRTEVGTPATASAKTIREFAGIHPVWPPNQKNPLWLHRGSWWIQWQEMNQLFGPWLPEQDELENYTVCSQYLQAESLRYVVESMRRREPATSGILIWMGNEPYANTANTSVIEANGMAKFSHGFLQRCFAHQAVTCRYEGISYKAGDNFTVKVYAHDHSSRSLVGEVTATLVDCQGQILQQETKSVNLSAKVHALDLVWQVTPQIHNLFALILELKVDGRLTAENCYLFTTDLEYPLRPLREYPAGDIIVDITQQQNDTYIAVESRSGMLIPLVHVESQTDPFLFASTNGFHLLPGQIRKIKVKGIHSIDAETLYLRGIGVDYSLGGIET
ncbi:MAG: hypothetical protein M0Q40_00085 [Limnochordia bacterium]|nr:hypothetical protein [Limnochordia bacterium]MDD4517491.1 glycoside hydrolase family 2 TIM barrel-domain containing protein [Limnochordia bacterium]